jgi:tetraacyldisaccharide 4'-kinase
VSPFPQWVQQRDESRLRRAVLLPLVAPAWIYSAGARIHRAWYRPGSRHETTLPVRVLSVGNLVVGGTAKTPTSAWLANALRRRGFKVALASRGYSRRMRDSAPNGVISVSDGSYVLSRAEIAGDEPMVLAGKVPGVPVLVGADRVAVGRRACSAFGAEVLILDDGFQHHPLHRDIDMVMIDAHFGFGNRKVLPRGPLREPLSALRFADVIGIVDGSVSDLPKLDLDTIRSRKPDAKIFTAYKKPCRLRPLEGGGGEPPEVLAGAEVGLIAGLARPDSLKRTVEGLGATVVAEQTFRDHHHYRSRDLRRLRSDVPIWITTEKDAVKITPAWAAGADIRVLSIELEVTDEELLLDWLVERLGAPRPEA